MTKRVVVKAHTRKGKAVKGHSRFVEFGHMDDMKKSDRLQSDHRGTLIDGYGAPITIVVRTDK